MEFKISRRDMLKMVGGAVAAYSLGSFAETPSCMAAENKSGISYNGEKIPVMYEADICVVGGGPSGVASAVTAGRKGSSVLL